MTLADLRDYAPEWVTPVSQAYRGHTLHQIPPNGQGIAALIALGILQNFDLAARPIDHPDTQHLLLEAMKLAFADVYAHVADARHMRVTPEQMLRADYLAERARLIDPNVAQAFACGHAPQGGTVYLTAADRSGMMVSFIQSNYMGFGSGVVVPGTGVSLQNRGHCFSTEADHPNAVAGGKRPFHTIIPGFLMRDGAPVMSFGVMGGNMQPQGQVQTLVRMLDYGQQPQAASRRAALEMEPGAGGGCGALDIRRRGARPARPRPRARRHRRPVHGFRFRPVHLAPGRPGGGWLRQRQRQPSRRTRRRLLIALRLLPQVFLSTAESPAWHRSVPRATTQSWPRKSHSSDWA